MVAAKRGGIPFCQDEEEQWIEAVQRIGLDLYAARLEPEAV